MTRGSLRVLAFGLAATAIWTTTADAVERKGLLIGLSLGGGKIACDGCPALRGPGLELHLGWMLQDRLSLEVDASKSIHSYEPSGDSDGAEVLIAGARYWLRRRVWLKEGLGGGRYAFGFALANRVDRTDPSFAFMTAAGVEVLRWHRVALDVQGRFSTFKLKPSPLRINTVMLLVGITRY